jgi:hypothetical protein
MAKVFPEAFLASNLRPVIREASLQEHILPPENLLPELGKRVLRFSGAFDRENVVADRSERTTDKKNAATERTAGEDAGGCEIPLLVHWKISSKDLSYLERGALSELEHYVSEKRREAGAKWPEPLCEADGAPVRYACYTGELETESGPAWLSLCIKLYVGGCGEKMS